MCGRFTLHKALDKAQIQYATTNRLTFDPRFNVSPGRDIPIILESHQTGERRIGPARWGLIPAWAKDKKIGYKAINARAETIADKPMFRDAFRRRRCIIPADGFYEWHKPTKQPFYFVPIEPDGFFCFAGLWERWKHPAGETVVSCSIVTTAANAVVQPVHLRMPAALAADEAELWLSCSEDTSLLQAVLHPYAEGRMTAWPVSKAVNSPQSNRPELLERLNSR